MYNMLVCKAKSLPILYPYMHAFNKCRYKKNVPPYPPPLKKPHEQKRKQRLEIKQKQKQTNKTTKKRKEKEIKRTPSTINYS